MLSRDAVSRLTLSWQPVNIIQGTIAQGLLHAQKTAGEVLFCDDLLAPEMGKKALTGLSAGHARRRGRTWHINCLEEGHTMSAYTSPPQFLLANFLGNLEVRRRV